MVRIKIVPTLGYDGDGVKFRSFRIDGDTVHHSEKWVSAEDRGKEALKEGDYRVAGADFPTPGDGHPQYCEVILIVETKLGSKKVYVTGACAIYEINDQGETLDKLFHA